MLASRTAAWCLPTPSPQQTVEGTEQHPVLVGEQAMPELLQGGPMWLL